MQRRLFLYLPLKRVSKTSKINRIAQKPERNVPNNRVINATTLLDRKLFTLSIFPIEKQPEVLLQPSNNIQDAASSNKPCSNYLTD